MIISIAIDLDLGHLKHDHKEAEKMRMRGLLITLAAIALLLTVPGPAAAAAGKPAKPTIMKGCTACHEAEQNTLRGKFVGFSEKFSTVSVDVGPLVWVVSYDGRTEGSQTLKEMKKGKEMKLRWEGTQDKPLATLIKPKPPLAVPEEKQVSFGELRALIQKSPEKGGYALFDSRPTDAFMEGHIPFAENLPYPRLKQMGEKALPSNKDMLIVFYCGGFA